MRRVNPRQRNKTWYRFAHLPIWLWVFFVLPGHLTAALFKHGGDVRHLIWLGLVVVVCFWRGYAGRLPGVEERPYVTHWGVDQPNLWYRVICYTAAWIDLLVPFTLNAIGLVIASAGGVWLIDALYRWLYYPLALLVVAGTALNLTPRAKRSTLHEGTERARFYTAIWTVVPAQVSAWAAWRLLEAGTALTPAGLARGRLVVFLVVGVLFLVLGIKGRLPRTAPDHEAQENGTPPSLMPAEQS